VTISPFSARQVIAARSAAEKYFKAATHSRALAQEAAEIRLRAERKAGEILIGMARRGERAGRGDAQKLQHATFQLSDLGVEKTQSHRWQAIAEVPNKLFEEYISATTADDLDELTTVGLMRVLKESLRELKREANREIVESTESLEALPGQRQAIRG
jgi:hypothetical protein